MAMEMFIASLEFVAEKNLEGAFVEVKGLFQF
jgi:hypothetical protein